MKLKEPIQIIAPQTGKRTENNNVLTGSCVFGLDFQAEDIFLNKWPWFYTTHADK